MMQQFFDPAQMPPTITPLSIDDLGLSDGGTYRPHNEAIQVFDWLRNRWRPVEYIHLPYHAQTNFRGVLIHHDLGGIAYPLGDYFTEQNKARNPLRRIVDPGYTYLTIHDLEFESFGYYKPTKALEYWSVSGRWVQVTSIRQGASFGINYATQCETGTIIIHNIHAINMVFRRKTL